MAINRLSTMKRLLLISFLFLVSLISRAQTYDAIVESTDSLIIGNILNYQGQIINLDEVTYHEFSSDSINWHKVKGVNDIWVRFSNDVKNTWFTLPTEFVVNITGNEPAFNGWDKNEADDFSGDYNDLINQPTLPTQYWELSRSDLFVRPLNNKDIEIYSGQPDLLFVDSDNEYYTKLSGINGELWISLVTTAVKPTSLKIIDGGIEPSGIKDKFGAFGSSGDVLSRSGTNGLEWVTPDVGGDMYKSTYDPASINEQLVGLTASQSLTNKIINGVALNSSGSSSLFLNQAGGYTSISPGVTDHSLLSSLDYANSGHTGFAGTGVNNTFTGYQTFSNSVSISGQIDGAPTWNGNLQLGYGGAYVGFVSGSGPSVSISTFGSLWMSTSDKKLYFTNNETTYDLTAAGGSGGDMYKSTYDPASINEQLVGLTASQSLTNKIINGVALNSSGSSSLFLNQAGNYTAATGAGTDLSYGGTLSTVILQSSTGNNVNIQAGTNVDFTGSTSGTLIINASGSGSGMIYPGAGIPVSTGSAWGTSITNNSNNWNDAYNNKIVSAGVTGTTTKTITLNQQDGGIVTALFTDLNTTNLGKSTSNQYTSITSDTGTNTQLYWTGTQAQYDALGSYDSSTIYFIED